MLFVFVDIQLSARKMPRGKPRKNGEKSLKRKANDDDGEGAIEEEHQDDLDRQPTEEELRESEKPENQMNVESVRDKKRKLTEKQAENSREKLKNLAKETAHDYLIRWKNDKKQWKFEKVKQKFIQNNALNEENFNQEMWPIVLEYLGKSKGASRDYLIETAQKVIQEVDQAIQKDPQNAHLLHESRYLRARELLQMLN
ncbi:uncharacterized protein C7orf50 [Lutzomyia longipalpis]|uniref:WKF domain-containing protein n=1 Tax=Lutzomyia longipalpis TaxID=7200 RepID=A0A1B0CEL7_LUTLO|nr:uncharacterized protein C7orf50 [Lutzomyia longipalpis]